MTPFDSVMRERTDPFVQALSIVSKPSEIFSDLGEIAVDLAANLRQFRFVPMTVRSKASSRISPRGGKLV